MSSKTPIESTSSSPQIPSEEGTALAEQDPGVRRRRGLRSSAASAASIPKSDSGALAGHLRASMPGVKTPTSGRKRGQSQAGSSTDRHGQAVKPKDVPLTGHRASLTDSTTTPSTASLGTSSIKRSLWTPQSPSSVGLTPDTSLDSITYQTPLGANIGDETPAVKRRKLTSRNNFAEPSGEAHFGDTFPAEGDDVSMYINDGNSADEGHSEEVDVVYATPAQQGTLPGHARSGQEIGIELIDGSLVKGRQFEGKTDPVVHWIGKGKRYWFTGSGKNFLFTTQLVKQTMSIAELDQRQIDADAQLAKELEAEYRSDSRRVSSRNSGKTDLTASRQRQIDADAELAKALAEEDDTSEAEEEMHADACNLDEEYSPADVDGEEDDEEIIYAPGEIENDSDDEEDEAHSGEQVEVSSQTTEVDLDGLQEAKEKNKEILRGFLKLNRKFCDEISYEAFHATSREERPIAMSCYHMVRRSDVDSLLDMYMSAITDEAHIVLGKGSDLDFEDLISLTDNGTSTKVHMKGVYVNTMRSGIGEYQGYVGSVPRTQKGIYSRLGDHMKSIRKGVRSAHYDFARQDGTVVNFRVIAKFPLTTAEPYVIYLEALLMIWLDYFQYPGYYRKYNPRATYDWTGRLRDSHPMVDEMPALGVKGTNRAWPLYQGFQNKACYDESPCQNPNGCPNMTYPYKDKKGARYTADSNLPFGAGYLCAQCYVYLKRHKTDKPTELCQQAKRVFQQYEIGQACKGETCTETYNGNNFMNGFCRKCYAKNWGKENKTVGKKMTKHTVGQKCAFPECTKVYENSKSRFSNGYCKTHYYQKVASGEITQTKRSSKTTYTENQKCANSDCSNVWTKGVRFVKGLCRACASRADYETLKEKKKASKN